MTVDDLTYRVRWPGPWPWGLGSIGTLGKLTAEVVEGIDRGSIEAAEAVRRPACRPTTCPTLTQRQTPA